MKTSIKTVILAALLGFSMSSFAADTCIYSKYKITKAGLVASTDTSVFADPELTKKTGQAELGAYFAIETKSVNGKKVYKIQTTPGQDNAPVKVLGWADAKHFDKVAYRNCSF